MSTPGIAGGWVRACRLAALGEDGPVHVDIGQCPVCLVRTGDAVYALRDECTHQAVPLSDGEVADGAIESGCTAPGSTWRPDEYPHRRQPGQSPSSLSGSPAGTSTGA